jgi:hypothetical protein
MSLPMILTAEGIPHALRLVGTMPIIFVWIGLGLSWASGKIPFKNIGRLATVLLLLLAGGLGFWKYFVDFPSHAEAREAYTEDMVYMADDLNNTSQGTVNYMVTGEFGLKTVLFLTHPKRPQIIQMETYELQEQFRPTGEHRLYVTPAWIEETENQLQEAGYHYNFRQVKSRVDGRTLYYVSQN